VLSPFRALAFNRPIVIAGGLATAAPSFARDLFIAAVIPAALLGGWLVAVLALRWIALEHPGSQRLLAWLVCGAVSVLVGGVATRTVLAIWRRELLPRRRPRTESGDGKQLKPIPGASLTGAAIPAGASRDA
jgi:hypothetical protein